MFNDIIEELIEKWENTDNCKEEMGKKIMLIFRDKKYEYDLSTENVFDSPGYSVDVLFLAWIDDEGHLQTISGKREYY